MFLKGSLVAVPLTSFLLTIVFEFNRIEASVERPCGTKLGDVSPSKLLNLVFTVLVGYTLLDRWLNFGA